VKVLVDGNRSPIFACESEAIVRGDQTEPAISAASIVAKVLRDRLMLMLDRYYPQYGFAGHKGYPTASHVQALREHGISRVHRLSFGPVAAIKKAP
jgi:ribonuclease HII